MTATWSHGALDSDVVNSMIDGRCLLPPNLCALAHKTAHTKSVVLLLGGARRTTARTKSALRLLGGARRWDEDVEDVLAYRTFFMSPFMQNQLIIDGKLLLIFDDWDLHIA